MYRLPLGHVFAAGGVASVPCHIFGMNNVSFVSMSVVWVGTPVADRERAASGVPSLALSSLWRCKASLLTRRRRLTPRRRRRAWEEPVALLRALLAQRLWRLLVFRVEYFLEA